MNNQGINLFIVDDNQLLLAGLRGYLATKFGSRINSSTFFTDESALKRIDHETDIVIIDYDMKNASGNEVLESIKKINPKTEVIMLSSHKEIGLAIDSYCKGASDYIIKDKNAFQKIGAIVYTVCMFPVHVLVKEFGVSKFAAIFLINFITVGIIAFIFLKFIV